MPRWLTHCLLLALGTLSTWRQAEGVGVPHSQEGERPFKHSLHVPKQWLPAHKGPEVVRDCRGCHVYDPDPEGGPDHTLDPQEGGRCYLCHLVVPERNDSTFRFKVNARDDGQGGETLDWLREPGSIFRHTEHGALSCRECHKPSQGGVERLDLIRVPDEFTIDRGYSSCDSCHGPGGDMSDLEYVLSDDNPEASATASVEEAQRLFYDALNSDPAMQPDRLGPFRHDEHLVDPEGEGVALEELLEVLAGGGSPLGNPSCVSCHEPVAQAGIDDLHENRYTTRSCGTCHIGSDGSPLEFEPVEDARPTLVAKTFSHAQHLQLDGARDGAADPVGYERIETEGCHACHEYGLDEGLDRETFKVSALYATHEGCIECHSAWEPQRALGNTPLGHGDEHWEENGCFGCHAFSDGISFVDMARTPVERPMDLLFGFDSWSHPEVEGAEDLEASSCRECHRAGLPERPAAAPLAAFDHASHLSSAPRASECARCHRTPVGGSEGPVSLAASWGDLESLVFDAGACEDCHEGAELAVQSAQAREPEGLAQRLVPTFSHGDHEAEDMSCLDCHQATGDGRVGMGFLPGVEGCTACHGHSSEPFGDAVAGAWVPSSRSEITADFSGAGDCMTCHQQGFPVGEAALVRRWSPGALLADGVQHHPMDRDCLECHKTADRQERPHFHTATVFAEGARGDLHKDRGVAGLFVKNDTNMNCVDCHWSTSGRVTALSGADNPKNRKTKYGPHLKNFMDEDYITEKLGLDEPLDLTRPPSADPPRRRHGDPSPCWTRSSPGSSPAVTPTAASPWSGWRRRSPRSRPRSQRPSARPCYGNLRTTSRPASRPAPSAASPCSRPSSRRGEGPR